MDSIVLYCPWRYQSTIYKTVALSCLSCAAHGLLYLPSFYRLSWLCLASHRQSSLQALYHDNIVHHSPSVLLSYSIYAGILTAVCLLHLLRFDNAYHATNQPHQYHVCNNLQHSCHPYMLFDRLSRLFYDGPCEKHD